MRKLALALLLTGCFHTHSVAKDEQDPQSSAGQPGEKEGGAAANPKQARKPQEPGRPPLAAGPDGLFVPGGVEKVQNALASKGYLDMSKAEKGRIDAETSAGVRKFQEDQGIARTGNPDHETARRLGLDADALFRKSEDTKK
jgi:hypothetical protein